MARIGKRWGPKVTYLRDWRKVNDTYVQRGVYYLDFEWVQNWDTELVEMNRGKRGAPYQFPKSLIRLQSVWAQLYNYRTVEGITRQIRKFGQIPAFNDYTTIWRRVTAFDEVIPIPEGKELSVATDGSGMKMNMSGEYFEDKYGDGRKKYIKVIITADPYDKDLLKVEVSLEGEGPSEPEVAKDHMKELMGEGHTIKEFFGDGALDTHDLFDLCGQNNIKPVIKIRKNAIIDPGGGGSPRRREEVKDYIKDGYEKWARKNHYGRRWPGTEGIFASVKVIFGERVRSKKVENMCKEVYRRFWTYQVLKKYGEEAVTF